LWIRKYGIVAVLLGVIEELQNESSILRSILRIFFFNIVIIALSRTTISIYIEIKKFSIL
jgi:hypothetical protein